MNNFSGKPVVSDEQLWRLGRLWNRIRSVRVPSRLFSRPRRRRLFVYLALHMLHNESASLWVDLKGLCYLAGLDHRSAEAVRKWLPQPPWNQLIERKALEIHRDPNEPSSKQRTSRKGVVCHDGVILVGRGYHRSFHGRRRSVYRLIPSALDLGRTPDGQDLLHLPLLLYGDTEFLRRMGERLDDQLSGLFELLIGIKNRLTNLLFECGIIGKEAIHPIDPKAAVRLLEQDAGEFKRGLPEETLKWQALVRSRELALLPKLYSPTCVTCGRALSRLDLKHKGNAICPGCNAKYFGFTCHFCVNPIVVEASASDVACQVCGALYQKQK